MIADAGFRSLVVPLRADHVAAVRPTLLLLEAGALVLLLIGAVNLVNLLLIRASGRVKELAVRQALGAGWRYLVSEVVVETTLLTFAGGLLGLAVGAGGIHLLRVLGADRLPLGKSHRFRRAIGIGRPGRSHRHGHRVRGARRLVQSSTPSRKCASIGEPWRHERARRSNPASQFHRLSDCLGVRSVGRSWSARPQSSASDGRLSRLPVRPRPHRANPASVGRLPRGRPPEICGKLDGQTRPPAGSVVRGRGQQCALQWQQRQKRRHGSGSRSPPRRIRARALFLRSRRRLFSRHGFLPARRTFPHRRRFASLRASLRCG